MYEREAAYSIYRLNMTGFEPVSPYPFPTTITITTRALPLLYMKEKLPTIYIYCVWYTIGLMSRVFDNGPGDQGSILDRVIPKTQKIVVDATLLNTQHYKVRIKGKVEQTRKWSITLPYTMV